MSEAQKGKIVSEETKMKMSKAHRGVSLSEKQRKSISVALRGKSKKPFSEEARHNMSEAHKGKVLSDETKQRMSISQTGHPGYMKDKKHSEETKQKMSGAHKGKVLSEETKRRMRISAIEHIQNNKLREVQITPSYNPRSIPIIEEYGKVNGYNFQHAMNGGEFRIPELGYWVDGYDNTKNVVIEYYEKRHRRSVDRDLTRMREIMNFLNCKFIIYDELTGKFNEQ